MAYHHSYGVLACMCTIVILVSVIHGSVADYPFNDPSLPWNERVDDVVKRLTIYEIAQQMAAGGAHISAPGVPRLGIKPYRWDAECLRGDVGAGPATSFPQSIGLAASFSKETVFNISRATALEVRAKYNNYSAAGDYDSHTGASCFSPVINIMRDPRWGRNQETYGEDPFLSGEMARKFVTGLQGDNPRYVLASAGCKHFDVYAGPETIPESRFTFNAILSETDWRMTFLPAFKACVNAGSYSLMCSYNSINGVPACGNKKLLTDILRTEWGFKGYVVGDEGAIQHILDKHNYTKTVLETAALAINSGCNLENGDIEKPPFLLAVSEAVRQGILKESTVRDAAKPLYMTKMRLGLFDPPSMNPYTKLDPKKLIQSPEHQELAIVSAMRTFVLMKNSNKLLPLKQGYKFDTMAIVGPMANYTSGIFGSYAADPEPFYVKTPLKGLSSLAKTIKYAAGCPDPHCKTYNSSALRKAVTGADITVLCIGTGADLEAENNDRADIELPLNQTLLLQEAVKTASNKPVILLLFNAGPINISWAIDNSAISVIMECFFPAQGTGEALRRVFYNEGEGANPAGRLPATWPVTLDKYPAMINYTMKGRTYRYADEEPMFPFGYGLSYTKFQYSNLIVPPKVMYEAGGEINVTVTVTNVGMYEGEEVTQVYISWTNTSLPGIPKLQLASFERKAVPLKTSITVSLSISFETLQVWDDTAKKFTVLKGDYHIYVGGQQPNSTVTVDSNILQTSFTIL